MTVDYVVPLTGGRSRDYSTHLARGAIFRSLPGNHDRFDTAFDLVHEVGHQVLQVWQSIDPIIVSDPNAMVFSQIRKVDRPAIQSFHAAVALAYMRYLEITMGHHRGIKDAARRRGRSYAATLSHSLALALESLRDSCLFSDLGEVFMGEMEPLID